MPTNLADSFRQLLVRAAVVAAATIAVTFTAGFVSGPAHALPAYARQTGLPCGQCHVNPRGGGPRTAFGQAFARNGHRLPRKRSRTYRRSYPDRGYRYNGGYGMGPGMMDGYGGMGRGG